MKLAIGIIAGFAAGIFVGLALHLPDRYLYSFQPDFVVRVERKTGNVECWSYCFGPGWQDKAPALIRQTTHRRAEE